MIPNEIFLYANAIAVLAILNWVTGDRPLFGLPIVLRNGPFWSACRWFGLGLFVACSAVGTGSSETVEWIAMVGAVAILFGTARKRSKSPLFQIANPASEDGPR